MKSFKSIRKVILAAALILAVMIGASAAEEPVMGMAQVQLIQDGYIPTAPAEAIAVIDDELAPLQSVDTVSDEDTEAVEAEIFKGISEFEEVALDNAIPLDEFGAIYSSVVNEHPELFYASQYYSYYGRENAGKTYVTKFVPRYKTWNSLQERFVDVHKSCIELTSDEKQAIKDAQKTYDDLIEDILDEVERDWSTLEKLLYLHDYLAAHYEYDMRVYDPERYQETIHDSYTFLTKGTGVCQAYYLTYRALLDELEITSDYASSENAIHIWNLVYINENWYHVDVTWDDPTPDRLGQVCHDWFLTSTTQMLSQDSKKSDWVSGAGATANDTSYDKAYWRDVNTAFVEEDGKWYYYAYESHNNSGIYATGEPLNQGTKAWNVENGYWEVIGDPGYIYSDAFTGLAECGDWIIYNTPEQIVAWNPETKDTKTLLTYKDESKDIYGFSLFDDDIKYVIANSPNGPFTNYGTIEDVDKLLGKPKPVFQEEYTKAVNDGKTSIKLSEDNEVYIERGDDNTHYFMAAVYGANHRMKSFKMISSAEIKSKGYTEWVLTLDAGDTVKLFLLNGQMVPEA